jgi:hypothetical protein
MFIKPGRKGASANSVRNAHPLTGYIVDKNGWRTATTLSIVFKSAIFTKILGAYLVNSISYDLLYLHSYLGVHRPSMPTVNSRPTISPAPHPE